MTTDPRLRPRRVASWIAILSLLLGLVTLGLFDVTQNTPWNSTDILSAEDERDAKFDCTGNVGQTFVVLPAATLPAVFLVSYPIGCTQKLRTPSFIALPTAVSRGPPVPAL
jgi:hypothetical protein